MIGRRGLTLLELMLTLALSLILLGVAAMPRGGQGSTSQGLAQLLAEELRGARIRAITSGKSVALVLPTRSGQLSHSQSYYILEGFSAPTVSRVVNLAGEFPRASLFMGVWPLNSLSLRNPGLLNTAIPGSSGLLSDSFDASRWLPAGFSDFALIFTPSGGVTSNGLTSFDGDYHILVGQGVTYDAASSPPPGAPLPQYPIAYRVPRAAGLPWTVNVSRTGSVTINEGVTGSSGVQVSNRPLDSGSNPAPPRLSAAANHPPSLVGEVDFWPKGAADTLPTGATATLAEAGHMTMRVRAKDIDGDTLWLKWNCTSGRLSGGAQEIRMEPVDWSGKDRVWEGVWEWYPPAGNWSASDLTFQVSDRRGGTFSGNLGAGSRVAQLAPGKLAYIRDDAEVCVCKPDGTSVLSYAPDLNSSYDQYYWSAVLSPDGSRVALTLERSPVDSETSNSGVVIMSSDLRITHQSNLNDQVDPYEFPSWNQTGTRLGVVRSQTTADGDVVCSNVTDMKTNAQNAGGRVATTTRQVSNFSYSIAGDKYCYVITDWALPPAHCSSIMVGAVGGSEKDLLHNTPTPSFLDNLAEPCFNWNGSKIIFREGNATLKMIDSTGGTSSALTSSGTAGYWPVCSPHDNKVAFLGDLDGRLYVSTLGGVAHAVSAGYLPDTMAWAPDGSQLVFSADIGGDTDADANYELFRVNADGSNLVNLTNTPSRSEYCPSWSQR
ncbi:PD40 domain-containing protein [bacterium]|nr:PD40 domain-containing protein [bacterium]